MYFSRTQMQRFQLKLSANKMEIRPKRRITHLRNWVGLWLFFMTYKTIYTLTINTIPSNYGLNNACFRTCTSTLSQIKCKGCIPDMVKNNTEISVVEISPDALRPGRFCVVSWPDVTRLSITTADNVYFSLQNGTFDCLENLKYFRLSSPFLENFDSLTFRGLSNLTEFDLTGCNRMSFNSLWIALSVSENFPALSRIILASICFVYPFSIQEFMVYAMAVRPIRYIDLSHNNFWFQFSTSGSLCDHLDTLRIRDSEFYCDEHCQKHPICSSLRVYDMSGTINFFKRLTCRHTTFSYSLHPFFEGARILFSNEVIKESLKGVLNCSLELLYTTLVEEFHFAENMLPSFEFKIVNSRFKFVNLSYNRIEEIQPEAIKYLPSLTKVDLSHNVLYKAKSIKVLFKHSKQLRDIDLSANDIETLPNETFASNNFLEQLNLSANSFSQIHFYFWNLSNLRTIDLSLNAITGFDSFSRRLLDNWYKFHLYRNSSVRLILAGNPFSCSCSSLEFLNWFVASPISSASIHSYHCYIEGEKIPMTRALTAAQENCNKIRRQKLLMILGCTLAPFCLLITSAIAVIVFRRQRRKRQARLYEDRIRLMKENDARFKFAVFLSYSSDETGFVMRNIISPLQGELRNITHIDRDLVCYADRHFVPGRTIMSEMMRCLDECPVFVAIVTEAYCASRFCRYEIETAHTEGKPIILIFKEHVSEDKMDPVTRKIFRNFTRVKCVFKENGVDLQPNWEQLCKSIIELVRE